jgi:phosphatidate cytidylyltransferase
MSLLDVDRSGPALDIDWGPLQIHTTGRGVFFLWVTLAILGSSGIAVALSRKPELITRWTTWALIVPVVGLPIWSGRGATTVLAAVLAVLAVLEYARLAQLPTVDRAVLLALAVGYPVLAWLAPSWLDLVPLFALLCALPAVLSGDVERGIRRSAFTAFGSIWICWSLANLVVLWEDGGHRCRGLVRWPRAAPVRLGPASAVAAEPEQDRRRAGGRRARRGAGADHARLDHPWSGRRGGVRWGAR